jgi:hypothetical protein
VNAFQRVFLFPSLAPLFLDRQKTASQNSGLRIRCDRVARWLI